MPVPKMKIILLLVVIVSLPLILCAPAKGNKETYNFKVSELELEDPYEDKINGLDSGQILTLPASDFKLSIVDEFMKYPAFQAAKHLIPENRPSNFTPPKHFIETSDTLLDHRYAKDEVFNDKMSRRKILLLLLKNWTDFCKENGVTTWMAHGTLLGWFWGQKIFPWDKDLDFQVSLKDMFKLWLLNGTIYQSRFLIDINPNSMFRTWEEHNVIDARIIDTQNGMYLDITALAYAHSNTILSCKSPHNYTLDDVLPLHSTIYEGIEVWRPERVVKMMTTEYTWKSLERTTFIVDEISYHWDQILNSFVRDKRQKKQKKKD